MGTFKILVIDDDEIVARAISRMLKGHRVCVEHDPRVAVARVEAGEIFDAVICDLTMPEMDGLEVLRALRARTPCPIFVLSSGALAPDNEADAVLTKPYRAEELRSLLSRLIAERTPTSTHPVLLLAS